MEKIIQLRNNVFSWQKSSSTQFPTKRESIDNLEVPFFFRRTVLSENVECCDFMLIEHLIPKVMYYILFDFF